MSCCCASGVTQTHAPVPSTRSGPLGAGSSYSGDMLPPPTGGEFIHITPFSNCGGPLEAGNTTCRCENQFRPVFHGDMLKLPSVKQ